MRPSSCMSRRALNDPLSLPLSSLVLLPLSLPPPQAFPALTDRQREACRLHLMGLALVCSGRMKLPPKDPLSVLPLWMLFSEHPREIVSVAPSSRIMRALSIVGKPAGYHLPG